MAENPALIPMSKTASRIILIVVITLAAFGVYAIYQWLMGAPQSIGGVGIIAVMAAVVLAMDWVEDRRKGDAQ
jgi:hypothetical protein